MLSGADKCQCRQQIFGVIEFRNAIGGKGHRGAGIKEKQNTGIPLYLKLFDEKPVRSAICLPIQESQVVSWGIFAQIGEVYTATLEQGGVQSLE